MKNINISDLINKEERHHIIQSTFDRNGLDINIEYPAVFRSAKFLRDFIIDIADFFHFKGTWKSRLTLIVDELNNNGIEYGSNENDINKMSINIIIIDNNIELVLEVEDTGRGKESKTAEEMNNIRIKKEDEGFEEHDSIRGRGLFMIIKRLVDELYFKDSKTGGLIVGIKKKIEIDN